mmetsp:Transcript_18165/g.20970  ORF Transcript_18165/g.20970 Transcript_18165/m.20970 type:complete len:189 (-) Transcript_18165:4-570(-)
MPTEYTVQQGWHLLKTNYWIKNEAGEDVYHVEGTNFTWGVQNTLKDKEGKELASIRQTKVVTFYPKFEVFRDGKMWATCTKENFIGFGKKEALLDIPGDNNYKIKGNKYAAAFEIVRTETGNLAGTVKKRSGDILRDKYVVSIEDGEDEIALIIIFCLIDGIYHDVDGGENDLVLNAFATEMSKAPIK